MTCRPSGLQPAEECRLVGIALRLKKRGIVAVLGGCRAFAPKPGEIECCGMRAAHEPHQVRRGQHQLLSIKLHSGIPCVLKSILRRARIF
jgi:hypothetical protein